MKKCLCLVTSLLVLFNFHSSSYCNDLPTLKSVVVIFRHGDRTIREPYPTDPYRDISYWPGGFGQLTDAGKFRLYNLGQWFRKTYDGFIPQNYSLYDTHIQSTDIDRTLMSALAFLAGLYPPTTAQTWDPTIPWQPIPVHTEKVTEDAVLAGQRPCPKYKKLYNDLYKTSQFTAIQGEIEDLYNYVSNHTGRNMTVLWQLQDLYDILKIEESFGYELPTWTKDIYPDKLERWAIFASRIQCFTPALARLKSGPLINEIVNHLLNSSRHIDGSYHRFKVYSAHETTIYNILTAMGIFNDLIAPYGTALVFELHRNNTSTIGNKNSHFVNILYKNSSEVFGMKLKECEFNCSLNKFVRILKPITIDLVSWEKECILPKVNSAHYVTSLSYLIFSLMCIISLCNYDIFLFFQ